MKDFYIDIIAQKKKEDMDIYNKLLQDTFGKILSWKEVQELDRDKQIHLMCELKDRIIKHQSKYDIRKLARAIQNSRSGAGGCAMTEFECAFCEEKEIWDNTAVPKICKKCAEKMAENIVLYNMNLEKN